MSRRKSGGTGRERLMRSAAGTGSAAKMTIVSDG